MRRSFRVLIVALLMPGLGTCQELLTRQVNLMEMTHAAAVIVRGEVLQARVEPHPDFPNISTLRVTLRVSEVIRGRADKQLSFRSYVSNGRFGQRTSSKGVPGAGYRIGDELVLFLYAKSRYGLTSTVGGDQGRFRVERQRRRTLITNPLRNRGLFEGVETRARAQGVQFTAEQAAILRQPTGPADLNTFLDVVRRLSAAKEAQ